MIKKKPAQKDNLLLILEQIKANHSITRSELSKILAISPPAISKNIEILLSKGIIKEIGFKKSSGGRKPIALTYNFNFCKIIVVCITTNGIEACFSNLKGFIGKKYYIKKDVSLMTYKEIISDVMMLIDQVIESSGKLYEDFKNITVIVPGIVSQNKVLVSNILPQICGSGLYEDLYSHYKINILIKNDINSKTLGQFSQLANNYQNIVYISSENTGVGGGIIIDGEIFEGSYFGAGEIGYLVFEVFDEENKTLRLDYFENIVSKENIFKILQINSVSEYTKEDGSINFEMLENKLESNKVIKNKLFDYLAKYYAMLIHNISTTINPELIILSGNLVNFGEKLYECIIQKLKDLELLHTNVKFSKENDHKILGAIYYASNFINSKILSM